MIIEICSQPRAIELVRDTREKTAVISITSQDEPDIVFPENPHIVSILPLKFNDHTSEYDEEGIPYGRPLPKQEDFSGLKDFADRILPSCEILLIHCWEGTSRSAAAAAALYEYRGCLDMVRTQQRYAPNPLVYTLTCRELGISPGSTPPRIPKKDPQN